MNTKMAKSMVLAIAWVSCFALALSAPYIDLKRPAPEMIGYLASFGFLGFALCFFILKRRG